MIVVAGDRLPCRRNTSLELDLNRVLAGAQPLGRKLNVPVLSAYVNGSTIHLEGADRAVAEVDQQWPCLSEGKGELLNSGSGIGVRNQCEGEVVPDVRDLRGPLVSQFPRNAGRCAGFGGGREHGQ